MAKKLSRWMKIRKMNYPMNLATASSVEIYTIQKALSGMGVPTTQEVAKIAKALRVKPGEIEF